MGNSSPTQPEGPPRTRHQRGFLFKKGNTWFLRYRETVRLPDGSFQRRRVTHRLAAAIGDYKTKGVARTLADEFIAPKNEARAPLANTTLGQFVEEIYLPAVESQKRISTFRGYRNMWLLYLKPHAAIVLRDFDIATGERILAELQRARDLSITTLRHIKAFLSGTFHAAKRLGIINTPNPMHDVELPKAKPAAETYAYSLAEIQQMIAVLDEPAATIVTVAAFTGARKSEIRGFRWEDYDGEQLKVQRTFWRSHQLEPKTKTSKAPIPVIAQVADRLNRLQQPSGLIFQSASGAPINLDALARKVIAPTLAGHGLAWHGWHAFRRGLATVLHHLGVSDNVIQRILRHSNVSVTQKCYIKILDPDVVAAMRKLES